MIQIKDQKNLDNKSVSNNQNNKLVRDTPSLCHINFQKMDNMDLEYDM